MAAGRVRVTLGLGRCERSSAVMTIRLTCRAVLSPSACCLPWRCRCRAAWPRASPGQGFAEVYDRPTTPGSTLRACTLSTAEPAPRWKPTRGGVASRPRGSRPVAPASSQREPWAMSHDVGRAPPSDSRSERQVVELAGARARRHRHRSGLDFAPPGAGSASTRRPGALRIVSNSRLRSDPWAAPFRIRPHLTRIQQ